MSTAERDEAMLWAVRASDPDFDGWPALAAWLGGDPARNLAYNDAMMTIADATEAARAAPATVLPFAAPARAEPRGRARRWLPAAGMAVAASVAVLLLVGRPAPIPVPRVIEVPDGPPRRIALADGSRIALAGGTRLVIDAAHPRRVTLDRGKAVFAVRHDAASPFSVVAGGHEIVDTGTAFEVVQDAGSTAVAVAEGSVIVDPARSALTLVPGDGVELRGAVPPRRFAIAPAAIGRWREDRMSYRDAPLRQVAADLSAALGRPIAVDPALDGRRFTGTLVKATVRERPDDLAALLDVRVRNDDRRWKLLAR